jgi:hypothetical protein
MTEEFKEALARAGMTVAEWEIHCAKNAQRALEFCRTLDEINKMKSSSKIKFENNYVI